MASHPIRLPSKTFKSKTEAINYFKKMLSEYCDGDEINSFDDQLLFEVIQRHPDINEKKGVGIKRFYRDKSSKHPTSCFHLERYDESTSDFSATNLRRDKIEKKQRLARLFLYYKVND